MISLGEGSPYETMHGDGYGYGDKMATSVEKIAELELHQNIDIPEISLVVHSAAVTVNKKCTDDGSKAKVVLQLCII